VVEPTAGQEDHPGTHEYLVAAVLRAPLVAAAPMPVKPPSTAAQLRTGGSAALAGAGSGHVRRRTALARGRWPMGAAGCAAVIRA
jgi:hypothetical protein